MRLCVMQTSPALLDPERNRWVIAAALDRVEADLIVLPELATSGYAFRSRAEVRRVAEPVPEGPTCRLLRDVAKRQNCAIVAGLPEVEKGRFFNTAVFVTPQGVERYRKMHLFWNEKKFFSPGSATPRVFSFRGVRVGVMICFDWFFPEVARMLALRGADVICHPSNLVLPYAQTGMSVRSLENGVFSATANRVGSERGLTFTGRSQIRGVKGELLGRLGPRRVGALTVRITPGAARGKRITPANHLLKDRRLTVLR